MRELPPALAPLAAFSQFIVHKQKTPVDWRTGHTSSPLDINNWQTAAAALITAELFGPEYGVGFVLTDADPFWFLDIDKCSEGYTWSALAIELLGRLPGAAVEVSMSGTGLHVIGCGVLPPHACKNTARHVELYDRERFVALTGVGARGCADVDLTASIGAIAAEYFPVSAAPTDPDGDDWTTTHAPEASPILDDNRLIGRALASGSAAAAFEGRASFRDLWTADVDALAQAFPTQGHGDYDASSADAALAQHLAFWTGGNCERVKTLMFKSALMRDKWTDRGEYYIPRTIRRAVSRQTTYYTGGTASAAEPEALREGFQYLSASDQARHFDGCVYVCDQHRAYVPGGQLLKPEQFKVMFGGYTFALDSTNDKTTRDAWEAFTLSQARECPKALTTCFKPAHAAGEIINDAVNIYMPPVVESRPGDVGPFLRHLEIMLPVAVDRAIVLAYMAACVQYPGVKFRWAPLLQGMEGNGKTLCTECVAYVLGRRYVHYPKALDIDNKFNAWLEGRLLIGVEDVYVPAHRLEVLEALKPMITGEYQEIQGKGRDQDTREICANFMLNSNHKDAVRKSETDRRLAVFYTAQQYPGDLERDGLDGDYFPELYDWLRRDGFARMAHYLATYSIPDELNPATKCHRAPLTSSTLEAIALSRGHVEQEIQEAIECGFPGFAGGWVSSLALHKLLSTMRPGQRVAPNKRPELMRRLGYTYHPGLVDGRVNNAIPLDGGKPRLYLKIGHIAGNLTKPADIVKAYTDAQTGQAAIDGAVNTAYK